MRTILIKYDHAYIMNSHADKFIYFKVN